MTQGREHTGLRWDRASCSGHVCTCHHQPVPESFVEMPSAGTQDQSYCVASSPGWIADLAHLYDESCYAKSWRLLL